jgi:Family of unknown function (DUF5681)
MTKAPRQSLPSNHSGKVGYGRPPAYSRFKPGQSGNPKGRPSGKKAVPPEADALQILGTVLRKILKEKLTVTDGDRTRRVSKLEAVLRSLVARAVKGEVRVFAMLVELLKTTAQAASGAQNSPGAEHTGIRVTFIDPRPHIEALEEQEEREDRLKRQELQRS